MKILVVNNMVPFIRGGAERLADNLVRHLRRYGHDADLLRIPFKWHPPERLYDELLACRMMRIFNVDRVIGLKFPAYLVPHPNKTLWLVHQYRQAYDLADTSYTNLPPGTNGQSIRTCIRAADNECFEHSHGIFAISRVVKQRLADHNQFECQVLHPPLDDAEDFGPHDQGDYIFCGGRINQSKRQHLLVEALRHTQRSVRLLIAGPPDSENDRQRLETLVRKYDLRDRVELQCGYQPRERLVRWINRSLACACVPYEEDYGYVTLEAFYAAKPVLTTTDAGGVLDFVTDQKTGRVCQPTPESLAQGLDLLTRERTLTQEWGLAAREMILEMNINWPNTVKRLVA